MKVADLIKKLQTMDEDAFVLMQIDSGFEEDVIDLQQYDDGNSNVVVLSNRVSVATLQNKRR